MKDASPEGCRGANSQQPTANSQQPTANSQQPTANSQQPTANSQQIFDFERLREHVLQHLLRRRNQCPELAEDFVQDALLKCHEQLTSGKTIDNLPGYTVRVAENLRNNHDRQVPRREKWEWRCARPVEDSRDDDPSTALIRSEFDLAVDRILLRLPADRRALFRSRVFDGATFSDLEAEMGIDRSTLFDRYRQACLRVEGDLRELLSHIPELSGQEAPVRCQVCR
jgi:RNA polymerase sigma factor (sigma-70 family)